MTFDAQSISLRYGDERILTNVSIKLKPGSITVLAGPNGVGKSSLLRILSGDLLPSEGEVRLNGAPLSEISIQHQAKLRCVMAQSSQVVFDFLVSEVVRMGWRDHWGADAEAAYTQVVADVEIRHLLKRRFNTLSGGEQQRCHFARALMQLWPVHSERADSRYLLLDEPTSSLDVAHELLLLGLCKITASRGVGVLIVLHDLNLAARFADVVVLMADGAVRACGTPSTVLRAATLTEIYKTPVHVEHHSALNRLLVLT